MYIYTVSNCLVKKCGLGPTKLSNSHLHIHSVKLSCQKIWLRAVTKKNKEARRVARSAAGVGGVIERMGSGQELVKHKPVRHKIEND